MSKANVIDFAAHKLSKEADKKFLGLIDKHICADPGAVQPIPSSLFERMDRLSAKAEKIKQEQLLEG